MKFLILGLVLTSLASAKVSINEKTPHFSLTSHKGEIVSLEKLKGKIVVLEWFNAGCPFVRKFYDVGVMQELQKKYATKVTWLTINSSAPEKQGHISDSDQAMKTYQQEKMNSYALLLDGVKGKTGLDYEAKTTPHMFIINEEGNLVYDGAIDSIPSTDSKDISNAKPLFEIALVSVINKEKIMGNKNKPYGCSVKY